MDRSVNPIFVNDGVSRRGIRNCEPPFGGAPTLLGKLFHEQLANLVSSQNQFGEVIPFAIQQATSESLIEELRIMGVEAGYAQNDLARVADLLGIHPDGAFCEEMYRLVRQILDHAAECNDSLSMDAALAANVGRIIRHQTAAYGATQQWACQLGCHEIADILERLRENSGSHDRRLTKFSSNNPLSRELIQHSERVFHTGA